MNSHEKSMETDAKTLITDREEKTALRDRNASTPLPQ